MKRWQQIGLMLWCILVPAVTAGISQIISGLPFTLVNGTVADATQVMADFNQIVNNVNANAAKNGVNTDITALAGLSTPLTVPQGGTGVNTLTSNGVLYGNGAGVVGSARCTMDANSSKACTSSTTATPAATSTNTTADAAASSFIFQKNRTGGNSGNSDVLGSVTWKGFANGGQQSAANIVCTQNGAAVGSNIPSICNFQTSTTAGQLNINFQLPSTNGSNNQVLKTDGTGVTSWTTTPTIVDVQNFTATGANTWTRPAGVTWVQVDICGAGGGGAGGHRAASGSLATGGGAGGGAYCLTQVFKATDAGSSQTVTLGTGGTPGAGATVNGNAGTGGGIGGNSTFGSILTAFGGGGGSSGTSGGGGGSGGELMNAGCSAAGGNRCSANVTMPSGFSGGAANSAMCDGGQTAAAPLQASLMSCPTGGGGGAGSSNSGASTGGPGGSSTFSAPGGGAGGGTIVTTNVGSAGGQGGQSIGCKTAAAGGAAGANAGTSTAPAFNYWPGCGGGGGGGGNAGSQGGAGGAGTAGAGGGGGGSGNNANGGAGGTGGNGIAVVTSW